MRSISISLLALAAGANAQWGDWRGGSNGDGNGFGGFGGGRGGSGDGSGSGSGIASGNAGAFGGQFRNGLGFDVTSAMRYRTIHGILAAVAFVVLFPLGSIFLRIIPGRLAWIIHAIIQIVGYLVYIAAAALGIYLVQIVRLPPTGFSLLQFSQTNAHPIIGLVVLAFLFFQPILGYLHHARFKRFGRRTAWSYGHLFVGRTMITLGIVNGGLGLQLAGASMTVITIYAVVGGVMWFLWLLSAFFGEWRRSRAARKAGFTNPPVPPYEARTVYGGPPVVHNLPRSGDNDVSRARSKPANRDRSVSSGGAGSVSSSTSEYSHRSPRR